MGYACPVCEIPQQDETHLANHLAFAAMLGREDHEEWLDEHAPDWEERGPEDLGERASTFAPEEEFEAVFEDTTGGHDHGGPGRFEDAVPRQRGRQAMGGETDEILADAEAMTREMYDPRKNKARRGTTSMIETDGRFAPGSTDEARELYESVGTSAQVVTREVAKSMAFDREEYRERVTNEVVETARDALFASLLEVQDGSREEYEEWREGYEGDVDEMGSENVDRVVWHAFDGEAIAATYQNEPEAARSTLRRQAFGRLYRPVFE